MNKNKISEIIADKIKAEHDKVQRYYANKGKNSGGIEKEEQVRLDIFKLCESIARNTQEAVEDGTEQDSSDEKKTTAKKSVTKKTVNKPVANPKRNTKPLPISPDTQENIKPIQNEFGEFI